MGSCGQTGDASDTAMRDCHPTRSQTCFDHVFSVSDDERNFQQINSGFSTIQTPVFLKYPPTCMGQSSTQARSVSICSHTPCPSVCHQAGLWVAGRLLDGQQQQPQTETLSLLINVSVNSNADILQCSNVTLRRNSMVRRKLELRAAET